MNETTSTPLGQWFTNLPADVQADITAKVNEEGYPLDDIQEFIEQYGVQAYSEGHYLTWCEFTEHSGADNEAIEAFIEEFGIDRIGEFGDAYLGKYDSRANFAEDHVTQCYPMEHFPSWVVIDWEATWDNELSNSFTYNAGHVFLSEF